MVRALSKAPPTAQWITVWHREEAIFQRRWGSRRLNEGGGVELARRSRANTCLGRGCSRN